MKKGGFIKDSQNRIIGECGPTAYLFKTGESKMQKELSNQLAELVTINGSRLVVNSEMKRVILKG